MKVQTSFVSPLKSHSFRSTFTTFLASLSLVATLTAEPRNPPTNFLGSEPGAQTNILTIPFCWCPPGTFTMGSPPSEPERRPGEDQVQVTLTKGFWMAKFETTQGQWKKIMGALPGPLTAELP